MTSSPAFFRQPKGNGCIERFFRSSSSECPDRRRRCVRRLPSRGLIIINALSNSRAAVQGPREQSHRGGTTIPFRNTRLLIEDTCAMQAPSRLETATCLLAAAAAAALLVTRAVPYFPDDSRLVGGDYSWFFPALVVGHAWFTQHGWLRPPHFTPAFCGGVPFLANPQSVAYSLPGTAARHGASAGCADHAAR